MFNSVCFQIKTRKGTMVSLSKLVKSFSNYRGSVSQKRTKVFVRNSHKLEEKHVLLISVSGFSSKSQTKDISFRQFTMKFSREKSWKCRMVYHQFLKISKVRKNIISFKIWKTVHTYQVSRSMYVSNSKFSTNIFT